MDKFDIFADLINKGAKYHGKSVLMNWEDLQLIVNKTQKIYQKEVEEHVKIMDNSLAECRDNYGDGD